MDKRNRTNFAVKVNKKNGEKTIAKLKEEGIIDNSREITAEEKSIWIPIKRKIANAQHKKLPLRKKRFFLGMKFEIKSFAVNMPENYFLIFPIPKAEEVEKLDRQFRKDLDKIQSIIINQQRQFENTGFFVAILANTLLSVSQFLFQKTGYFGLQRSFYATEKCVGCGTCEKVCLSSKIEIVDKRPVWKKEVACTFCFACINFCPSQAIQAKGKRTTKKGRYHHPLIKAADIAKQKIEF